MHLNTLKPAFGAKKKANRVGRGIGSGSGKTCGLGHKGQKARSGYNTKLGFEGGQMPLQRRLPKSGFSSRIGRVTAEVRLHELTKTAEKAITLQVLREANIIGANIKRAKIVLSGKIDKSIILQGIKATRGARKAIEEAGGKVED